MAVFNDPTPQQYPGHPDLHHDPVWGQQDRALIALTDGKLEEFWTAARKLPPWRAFLIASIAYKARLITRAELDDLRAEANRVGGDGKLRSYKKHLETRRQRPAPTNRNVTKDDAGKDAVVYWPNGDPETVELLRVYTSRGEDFAVVRHSDGRARHIAQGMVFLK